MSLRAVVIGGGHNGLIAALMLAQRGHSVRLFESRPNLGGVNGPWRFGEYELPGLLHETSCLSPRVNEALNLTRNGLNWVDSPEILVPNYQAEVIGLQGSTLHGDVSASDRQSHRDWLHFLKRVKPLLERQLSQAPPSLELNAQDLFGLGSAGLALRLLGRPTMLELVRVLPMAVADWAAEHFESDLLRAALAFPALFGSFVGPRAAGTAINLLGFHALSGKAVEGGGSALISILEKMASDAGIAIETGSPVQEILVDGDRATGVRVGGSQVAADLVVASCDPAQVFLELLDPFLLKVKEADAIRSLRSRGVVAKVHLLIEGDFELDGRPGQPVGRAFLGCNTVDDLERTMDPPKYDQFSRRPALDLWIPEECRSEAANMVSILAYGAPFSLKGGWTSEARQGFQEAVVDQIESYSKGIRKRIRAAELLTPVDLAQHFNLPGGHLCHLEQALDQFSVMRPVPFANRYSTPIAGVYLAGSGCHPGGGLTGLPGYLGASAALQGS